MAEFEDKLNSILSDPNALGQIMSIAKALTGEGQATPATVQPTPSTPIEDMALPPLWTDNVAETQSAPKGTGSTALTDGFPMSGLDPKLMQTALRAFSEYSATDEKKSTLLAALQPFLKEERLAKMDKAIQIAKLSRVVRATFQALKGESADV